MPAAAVETVIQRLVNVLDRVVPKRDAVVLRTFPDHDDQARATASALHARGLEVTVLVDDVRPPQPPLDVPVRVLPARSVAGIVAFLRSRTVVHTHGVFGGIPGSRRRRWVNIWHGMPIKRLLHGSDVGRLQTDVTVATSAVHAEHLRRTWDLEADQVRIVGLPRNDVLVTTPQDPDRLRRSGLGRRLAIWLPTYRTLDGHADGTELGTPTQFEGADLDTLDRLMAETGYHLLIKPHPLAPRPDAITREHVTVWGDEEIRANGWTLYELLAQADLLISDLSSVWIDFLLLDRPIVIALSDREAYVSNRGTYFDDLDAVVPSEICTTMDELADAVIRHGRGEDPWRDRRRAALRLHHETEPGTAAQAVVTLIG